jgi:hypothetical protein
MASELRITFGADESVSTAAVRDALDALTEDDISKSSPISEGAPEAATINGDGTVGVAIEGYEGDWTRTSEDALKAAVGGVEGVGDVTSIEGGYEPE